MINLLQAANLCHLVYGTIPKDVFSQSWSIDGVNVGYALMPDGTHTFTFAGSENNQDWLNDFDAIPFGHPQLGTLHAGFWRGMEDTFNVLRAPLLAANGVISIQGHSLGCAHASILSALCAINKIPVAQLILFAPPRPGYRTIRDIIENHVPVIRAFQNGKWPFRDPVPDVPETIPGFPWMQIADYESVCVRPSGLAKLNPFSYHSIVLYEEAMRNLCA